MVAIESLIQVAQPIFSCKMEGVKSPKPLQQASKMCQQFVWWKFSSLNCRVWLSFCSFFYSRVYFDHIGLSSEEMVGVQLSIM